jgi:hypothetical protein
VLVLSRFAGAAEQMKQALIINPYDTHGAAQVIQQALQMSQAERRERHAALMENIRRSTCIGGAVNSSTRCAAAAPPGGQAARAAGWRRIKFQKQNLPGATVHAVAPAHRRAGRFTKTPPKAFIIQGFGSFLRS